MPGLRGIVKGSAPGQRHDDHSIAGQPREKGLVHGHSTDHGERPPADAERLDARQCEKVAFGAAGRHQRDAVRAVQGGHQSRLDAAMLVPEVTGADNPFIAILDLEHRETRETHGGARVIEQIVPLRLDAGNRRETKPIVVQKRALERRKPLSNAGALASEIFANDLDRPIDTKLVLL